jgi:hypothetical protein
MDTKQESDTRPHEHFPPDEAGAKRLGQAEQQSEAGVHAPPSAAPLERAPGPEA